METKEIDISTVQDFLELVTNESLWLSDILFYIPFDDNPISCSLKVLSIHKGNTIIDLKPNMLSNEVIINNSSLKSQDMA